MKKFIDVEATTEKIYSKYGTHPVYYSDDRTEEGRNAQTDCIILEMIYDEKRMVYADVRTTRHGVWKPVKHECVMRLIPEGRDGVYECTSCRMWILGNGNIRFYKYCPYCGAKMDGRGKTDAKG